MGRFQMQPTTNATNIFNRISTNIKNQRISNAKWIFFDSIKCFFSKVLRIITLCKVITWRIEALYQLTLSEATYLNIKLIWKVKGLGNQRPLSVLSQREYPNQLIFALDMNFKRTQLGRMQSNLNVSYLQ